LSEEENPLQNKSFQHYLTKFTLTLCSLC